MPTAYHPSYDSFLAPPPWNRFEDIRRPLWARGVGGGGETEIVVPEWAQDSVLFLDAQYSVSGEPRVINRGTGGSALDAKYGSVLGAYVYDGAAVLPGLASNYLSVPDEAALDITGDIEIVVRASMNNWMTGASNETLAAKYLATGNQRSYRLEINMGGLLAFIKSDDGTAFQTYTADAAVSFTAGETGWVKVEFDADNGASGSDATFFESMDGLSWSQVGSVITLANTTGMHAGTAPLEIGSIFAGTLYPFNGSIYRTIVRDGIDGTTVLDVDLADVADYATSFTATTGQTVTVNSTSSDTNDPLLLTHTGENYAYFPGVNGSLNCLSVPDSAELDMAGTAEIEFVARCQPTSWAMSGSFGPIISKNHPSWEFLLQGGGSKDLVVVIGSTLSFQSDTAVPFADTDAGWVRAVCVPDDGAGGSSCTFYTAPDQATEPTSWTQLGSVLTGTATPVVNTANRVQVGARTGDNVNSYPGSVYRAIVRDEGVTVLDFNAATDITDAGATSFTASSGQTVTVNRATSSRKTALVTRPIWLFGTDDYLEVAASELFQIPADQDLTMVCVSRHWATMPSNGVMIAQLDASNQEGFRLYYNNNVTATTAIEEPSGAGASASIATTNGPLYTYTGVIDRTAQEMTTYLNTTPGTPTDISSIGTLEDDTAIEPLHVGSNSGTTNFADAEIAAVAVWRRVLTADEIAAINTYYSTGV